MASEPGVTHTQTHDGRGATGMPVSVQPAVAGVIPDSLSFGDPNSRLFQSHDGVYRGISTVRADFYRNLLTSGKLRVLFERGLLLDTEIAQIELARFPLVLKHRPLPFVSYPYEWPMAMLKDAAYLIVELAGELLRRGLTLGDMRPWNVLFDGPKPVYVDFGSIVPDTNGPGWFPYDEFLRFYVNPLTLMHHGRARIARWLLHDNQEGISSPELDLITRGQDGAEFVKDGILATGRRILPAPVRRYLGRRLWRNHFGQPKTLAQLREQLDALGGTEVETSWTGYYAESFPSFAFTNSWTPKHHAVFDILRVTKPRSVLDIGCNRGWYAQLAATLGSRVVAFDSDETVITRLYSDARRRGLSIVPLVMDLRYPSPGYGLCNEWLGPATSRLQCEMVLALGLVHHLVFHEGLEFEPIVRALGAFSQRWLLVEFVPKEDQYVREWWSERFGWYGLDAFVSALRERFGDVRTVGSFPEPRVLLLCEK
jgi:Tellurite resistance protein TehB